MSVETAEGQDLPTDREVLTWDLLGEASRWLAQAVVDSGYAVDVVVAVARGGLPAGGAIAYALGTKAVGTLNVEFYTGSTSGLPHPSSCRHCSTPTRSRGCTPSWSTTWRTPARPWRWCAT